MTRLASSCSLVVESDNPKIFRELRHAEVMGAVWHKAWTPGFIDRAHATVAQESRFVHWDRTKDEWEAVRLCRVPFKRKARSVVTHPQYLGAWRLLVKLGLELGLKGPCSDHSRVEGAWKHPGNAALHPDAVGLTWTSVPVGIPTEYLPIPVHGKMLPGSYPGLYQFHPSKQAEVDACTVAVPADAILVMKGTRFPYRRVPPVKGLLHNRPDEKIAKDGKHRLLIQFSI